MVDIKDKKIVIVGGGRIGYRKAKTLLEFGGQVLVISPDFIEDFYKLKKQYGEKLRLLEDHYKKEYIKDGFMVIGATCTREVNREISRDAKNLNILCNVVDRQGESSFISQCVVNKEGLIVSTSTMGKFPYLSKKIKEDIGEKYSKYNQAYMDLLEEIRQIVLLKYKSKHEEIFDYGLSLNFNELKAFIEKLRDKNICEEDIDEICSGN